jgi:DNA-binding MarR family transcriptional regulator
MASFAEDFGFLLLKGSGHIVRATNAALRPVGLRVRQYSVLALARDAGGGMSQRALARMLGLDPRQVVQYVDELVEAGLVERRVAPADRRTQLVAATPAGRRLREEASRLVDRGVRASMGSLSVAEQEVLRSLLAKVVDPDLPEAAQTDRSSTPQP